MKSETTKYIDEFHRRYIHTDDLKILARDWLFFLGYKFRKNAGVETLLEMLLVDSLNKNRILGNCDEKIEKTNPPERSQQKAQAGGPSSQGTKSE